MTATNSRSSIGKMGYLWKIIYITKPTPLFKKNKAAGFPAALKLTDLPPKIFQN